MTHHDPELYARLFAMLHVLVRERPELSYEIRRQVDHYRSTYFVPGAEAGPAIRDALDEVLS